MGRKRTYIPLNVFLNSRLVGQLVQARTGAIRFSYDQSWIDWEHTMPISRSMPVRKDAYVGHQVIAVFDNLLPDNEPMRVRVAEKTGAQGTDAFSLLSEIGRDCVGALQFLPEDTQPQPLDELTGDSLSTADIAKLLSKLESNPLGIRSDTEFRISVAGAQEKTAFLYHNGEWIQPTGTTPTTHIVKPQIGKLSNGADLSDSVQNEYFCLRLMHHCGIPTTNANIMTFNEHKALVVERFDRRWTKDARLIRLPQEDCCQALSVAPTRKYQSDGGPGIVDIMALLDGSDEPITDRINFFKANILFWLIGATDGHAKNFSIGLLPQGRFRMTPLYDVITLQPSINKKQLTRKEFKLAMRIGGSGHYNVEHIHGRHFMQSGLKSGLSKQQIRSICDGITSGIDASIENTINEVKTDVPAQIIDSVVSGIRHRVPRLDRLD
jgi:serine/threonine-protein kinase HipA